MTVVDELLPVLVGIWLVLAGLYGAATTRHIVHLLISVSVLHSGAWLVLLGVGHASGSTAPTVDADVGQRALADPLVQALTVTDVVVSVAVTALLLAFAIRLRRRTHTLDPAELRVLRG